MSACCVITTINSPTKAIEVLHEKFGDNLIVVGDLKTPDDWHYKDVRYISDTRNEHYSKYNHYARKNIGYIEAIKSGASLIYDTDDDNIPNENWKIRKKQIPIERQLETGWINVYSWFCDQYIWPRGFSLKDLHEHPYTSRGDWGVEDSPIQQGMADGSADVDAIWRLVFKKENKFIYQKSIGIGKNQWCPFNSQSTWFFPRAYPLMYLPIYSTFRMCDIWRSFIAQRCLWEVGEAVTFHSPAEVFQDRNEHDLLKDLKDEMPGYLKNDKIASILEGLELRKGEESICENLLTCYQSLCANDILPSMEINSVKSWIKAYENATRNMG